MFPIKSSDAYIKDNGKRSTIGAELGAGGGGGTDLPEYSISDAGKVLTVGEDGELEWDESGGGGGDIEQYNILKDAVWEQGAIQSNLGSSYSSNKVASDTRIRMTSLITVGTGTPLYIKINNGYDVSIHYYNASSNCAATGSAWGDFDNKSVNFAYANIAIAIRKSDDAAITPTDISNIGIAVYNLTALINNSQM